MLPRNSRKIQRWNVHTIKDYCNKKSFLIYCNSEETKATGTTVNLLKTWGYIFRLKITLKFVLKKTFQILAKMLPENSENIQQWNTTRD